MKCLFLTKGSSNVTQKLTKNTYRKLLNICLASSDALAFAKLMKEQYTAAHAAHLI